MARAWSFREEIRPRFGVMRAREFIIDRMLEALPEARTELAPHAPRISTVKIDPELPRQMALFPETNPMLEDLKGLDINALSPIEAINKLYEWKKKFLDT